MEMPTKSSTFSPLAFRNYLVPRPVSRYSNNKPLRSLDTTVSRSRAEREVGKAASETQRFLYFVRRHREKYRPAMSVSSFTTSACSRLASRLRSPIEACAVLIRDTHGLFARGTIADPFFRVNSEPSHNTSKVTKAKGKQIRGRALTGLSNTRAPRRWSLVRS